MLLVHSSALHQAATEAVVLLLPANLDRDVTIVHKRSGPWKGRRKSQEKLNKISVETKKERAFSAKNSIRVFLPFVCSRQSG